jgi:NAD(P)-dependent dehydrogenase (short-subunit alcohol dehydrogenase family)
MFFLKAKRIIIMSKFTKVLHRTNYAAIDAASPEQSQAGRNILITGGSAVIGRAAARGFVTAAADVVAITSRSEETASRVAKEIEAVGKGTKVLGYQYEIGDEASANALWENLKRDGVEIDVLILNTSANIPTARERPCNPFRASEAGSD